jgi:glyoxylase-like metal-dependent hydrolase (beta-lactamase superfamily II)
MNLENKTGNLFHMEVRHGIYLISNDSQGPTEDGMSLAPGNATANSYLVIGEERALLFDLAVNHPGIREYTGELAAGKPVQLVLSHGHFDHTFHLNKYSDVWMHTSDEKFVREGMLGAPPINPCPAIHPLQDGDTIDLGGRFLDVINVPGHTPGSILLLDRQTKTLLSGDTCARRLLYGLTDFVPTNVFCDSLRRLQAMDFEVIYSAHDRCALPKSYIEHMIRLITDELPLTEEVWSLAGLDDMVWLVHGDVYTLDYFDMVVPLKYMEDIKHGSR